MKEQDAAHSFEKEILEKHIAHRQLLTFENYSCVGIPYTDALKAIQSVTAELTRLRSELQDTKSYYEDKLDARQRTIDQQFSELQQKDEAVLELSEILVIAYDALSVVRTEPTMSGSVLASFDKNKFIKIRGDFFEFLDKHKTLESLIKKAKLNN